MVKINKHKTAKIILLFAFILLYRDVHSQLPLLGSQTHFSISPPKTIIKTKSQIWVNSKNMIATVLPNSKISKWSVYEHLKGDNILAITPTAPTENDDIIVWTNNGFTSVISNNTITETKPHLLPEYLQINNHIIYQDKLLLATNNGLLIINANTITLEQSITFNDNGTSTTVYSLWRHNDTIWILTADGVYYLKQGNNNWTDIRSWEKVTLDRDLATKTLIYATYNNGNLYLASTTEIFMLTYNALSIENINQISITIAASEIIKKMNTINDILYIFTSISAYTIKENRQTKLIDNLTSWIPFDNKKYGITRDEGIVILNYDITQIEKTVDLNTVSNNNIAQLTFGEGGIGCGVSQSGYHFYKNNVWNNYKLDLHQTIIHNTNNNMFYTIDKTKNLIGISSITGETVSKKALVTLNGDVKLIYNEKRNGNIFILTSHNSQYLYSLKVENNTPTNDTPTINSIILPTSVQSYGEVKNMVAISPYVILSFVNKNGVLIYNTSNNEWKYLTTDQNSGGLPSSTITALSIDNNNSLWIGTASGVAYLRYRSFWTDANFPINVVKPVVGNSHLLSNDTIIDIAIDSNNNKWIGTKNEVLYVSENGNEILRQLSSNNGFSYINDVQFLEYEALVGQLFVMTGTGLFSIIIDVQGPKSDYKNVRIYPNPVYSSQVDTVVIDGLKSSTTLKIADAKNQVIYESLSNNSGIITWDLTTKYSNKVAQGLYLFYFSDGDSSHIEKVVIYR